MYRHIATAFNINDKALSLTAKNHKNNVPYGFLAIQSMLWLQENLVHRDRTPHIYFCNHFVLVSLLVVIFSFTCQPYTIIFAHETANQFEVAY